MVYRTGIRENSDLLPNVAFKTPDNRIVLIVANTSRDRYSFKVQYKGAYALLELDPGSVGTYSWNL